MIKYNTNKFNIYNISKNKTDNDINKHDMNPQYLKKDNKAKELIEYGYNYLILKNKEFLSKISNNNDNNIYNSFNHKLLYEYESDQNNNESINDLSKQYFGLNNTISNNFYKYWEILICLNLINNNDLNILNLSDDDNTFIKSLTYYNKKFNNKNKNNYYTNVYDKNFNHIRDENQLIDKSDY
jgi:hypothetical protein